MRFFISGQISDFKNIQRIMNQVKNAGHSITHDWTSTDTFLAGAEDKLANEIESSIRAKNDIQGVIDSDVYVLSSDNNNVGKGMYVELGAAIALYEKTGSPDIYVIGSLNHLSLFYLHPAVTKCKSIEEVLAKHKM